MGGQPAPWLEEILQTAGDISASTASKIQQAAEYWYEQQYGRWGEAWAQYAARQAAKGVLTVVATESDPRVHAAFRRREARQHPGGLYAGAAGPAGRADLELDKEYGETWMAARKRYDIEVRDAWRKADTDFVTSHRGELKAADPDGFKHVLECFRQDSPSAAPTSASPSALDHIAGTLSPASTVDFPDEVKPGSPTSGGAAPSAPVRPGLQAATRATGAGAR